LGHPSKADGSFLWQTYVPEGIRKLWGELSDETRLVAYVSAQNLAYFDDPELRLGLRHFSAFRASLTPESSTIAANAKAVFGFSPFASPVGHQKRLGHNPRSLLLL
jgi:hypothetical protein